MSGKTYRHCDACGRGYEADNRNLKRGWGLFCSKSCAAKFRAGSASVDPTRKMLPVDRRDQNVVDLKEIRRAVADYIATEGCSCCQDEPGHTEAMNRIGKLLKMKKYKDGSGFDYSLYKTKK